MEIFSTNFKRGVLVTHWSNPTTGNVAVILVSLNLGFLAKSTLYPIKEKYQIHHIFQANIGIKENK